MGVLVVCTLAAIAVAGVGAVVVGIRRRLLKRYESVDTAWATMTVQLRRRHELVGRILQSTGRRSSESTTVFASVVAARDAAAAAHGPSEQACAEQRLTAVLHTALTTAEADPRLRTNSKYTHLRSEIADTENRIAYSRQYFNDAVRSYNHLVTRVPSNLLAHAFGYRQYQTFEALESIQSGRTPQLHS